MHNIFYINTRRDQDPTRTITLRSRFIGEMHKRFNRLSAAITKFVVDEDCFALQGPKVQARNFQFRTDAQKVEAFMAWLQQMVERDILEVLYLQGQFVTTQPWTNVYVRSAYQRGQAQSIADMKAIGAPAAVINALQASMLAPFNVDRVALMYTRTFNDLKGITDAMSAQISRVLAQGLAEGLNPLQMAKNLVDRVEKIGISRAELLARTETVYTFNVAALSEYAAAEALIGKEVKVQWWTALDERVRATHAARHGHIYTREEAMALISEPNCRCTLLPYVESWRTLLDVAA